MTGDRAGHGEDEAATVFTLRYRAGSLVEDGLRGGVGFLLCLLPLVVLDTHPVVTWVLAPVCALFGFFGARTVWRGLCRYKLSDKELRVEAPAGLFVRSLAWDGLDRLHLRYYSTRRDRESGWMELRMTAKGARITLDSGVEGFDAVVARAAEAAYALDLDLSRGTEDNLAAMGHGAPSGLAERWLGPDGNADRGADGDEGRRG